MCEPKPGGVGCSITHSSVPVWAVPACRAQPAAALLPTCALGHVACHTPHSPTVQDIGDIQLGKGGIIANPNCSTIIALTAVTPLHRWAGGAPPRGSPAAQLVGADLLSASPLLGASMHACMSGAPSAGLAMACCWGCWPGCCWGCCSATAPHSAIAHHWHLSPCTRPGRCRLQGRQGQAHGGEHLPGSQRRRAGGNGGAGAADPGGAGG